MVKKLDILTHAVLWLILSVMAVSCASVEEPLQNKGEHGSTISFRFNIYTEEKGVASRALGVWEENAANIAERILSVDDMRILFSTKAACCSRCSGHHFSATTEAM